MAVNINRPFMNNTGLNENNCFFFFVFFEKMIYLNQQNYIQDSRNKRH